MTDGLRENLTKVFMLPTPAVEWLLMVFDAIQVFDDIADGDGQAAFFHAAAIDSDMPGLRPVLGKSAALGKS